MVRSMAVRSAAPEKGWQRFATKCRRLFNHKWLYLMLLPCLANFVIFHYWPMYGLQIAFKRFNIVLGAGASPWIGLEHFVNFFSSYYFWEVMGNTLRISLLSIVIGFPFPIFFALVLNEVQNHRAKTVFQTISYLPYFLSAVVVVGLVQVLLEDRGIVNQIVQSFGGESIYFLGEPRYFFTIYQIMGLWRWIGFDAVLYLSAISAVSQDLYEAAVVDGAGRFSRIWHITLPGIRSTIIILLIMRVGSI